MKKLKNILIILLLFFPIIIYAKENLVDQIEGSKKLQKGEVYECNYNNTVIMEIYLDPKDSSKTLYNLKAVDGKLQKKDKTTENYGGSYTVDDYLDDKFKSYLEAIQSCPVIYINPSINTINNKDDVTYMVYYTKGLMSTGYCPFDVGDYKGTKEEDCYVKGKGKIKSNSESDWRENCEYQFSQNDGAYIVKGVINVEISKSNDTYVMKPYVELKENPQELPVNSPIYEDTGYSSSGYNNDTAKCPYICQSYEKNNKSYEHKLNFYFIKNASNLEEAKKLCSGTNKNVVYTDIEPSVNDAYEEEIIYTDEQNKSTDTNTTDKNILSGLSDFGGKFNCSDVPETIEFIKQIFKIIKIAAPILVIVYGTLDYAKVVFGDKEDDLKKSNVRFIKRLIAAVIIFLLPYFIDLLLTIFGFDSSCRLTDIFG